MEIKLSGDSKNSKLRNGRRIQDSNDYKKPNDGTLQSNFTNDQIKEKLKNYKRLNKKEFETVKMGTWIKYINRNKKEFRIGGILTKVEMKLGYIVLRNPYSNISWSVQLKDNVFFVPDVERKSEIEEAKNELYRLYEDGKLELKKD